MTTVSAVVMVVGPLALIAAVLWWHVRLQSRKRINLHHEGHKILDVRRSEVDEGKFQMDLTLNGTHFAVIRGAIWRDKTKIYERGEWLV